MSGKYGSGSRGHALALALGAALAGVALAAVPPAAAPLPLAKAASGAAAKSRPSQRVDLNSASRAQLKTVRGLGDADIDKIMAHRPFLTSTEIVTKAGVPTGVYVSIKHQVVAIPKTLPKASKPMAKSSP